MVACWRVAIDLLLHNPNIHSLGAHNTALLMENLVFQVYFPKYVEDNLEESGSPNFDQVPALDKVFAEREHLSIKHGKRE